jgi:hypothetical protein
VENTRQNIKVYRQMAKWVGRMPHSLTESSKFWADLSDLYATQPVKKPTAKLKSL